MRIPVIRGIIDRRILVNYCVDPDVMAAVLPQPFRPQIVNGYAIGGICLIRLRNIRPAILPVPWGIGSENAAHRIAVQWESDGQLRSGVYIPRRDTNSRLNALVGGRIFPGVHHHATFEVQETDTDYEVQMTSDDGQANVLVAGVVGDALPSTSVFPSLQEASDFFKYGSIGYSDTASPHRYDGLELRCRSWDAKPLHVRSISSSYFQDRSLFPAGSVQFDGALLMRGIDHQWHSLSQSQSPANECRTVC